MDDSKLYSRTERADMAKANKQGINIKKSGRISKAEAAFISCRDWIGFGLAVVMLAVLILIYFSYSNIADVKQSLVVISVITALILLALAGAQALMNGVRPKASTLAETWKSISLFQKFVALYLLVCTISYFASPYLGRSDLWIGTSRTDGLRTQYIYGAVLFITANCIRKNKDGLLLLLAGTALLFSIIGLLQAYGIGFWEFPAGEEGPIKSFYTTMGNKNMVSAVLCIAIAVVGTATVIWEDARCKWLFPVFFILMWFMLVIENDSGIVGVGAFFLILPIICWNTPQRISRGLFVYSLAAFAFMAWRMLQFETHIGTYPYISFGTTAILGLATGAVLLILSWAVKKLSPRIKLSKKTWTILWAAFFAVIILVAVFIFMRIELTPASGFLYQFQQMLYGNFDDSFGSGRIFTWKRAIAMFPHVPLFGYGPDCFNLAFNEYNYYETVYKMNVIFDFAHNEYIQLVINYGFIGLAAYLAAMFSLAVRAIKRKERSPYIVIFAMGGFIYCVQAFFSFSHLIIAPVFWAVLGLAEASIMAVDRDDDPDLLRLNEAAI